ncbi:Ctr copper transporter [Pterulicium gracile]|uniref:Copper transport protein n=1 Tax=Pterulicium gracile TaxID=1884261 RepID=A0A5C3Q596_9AGAR|nr:Ctr copper transporter [Pterula gracilis]
MDMGGGAAAEGPKCKISMLWNWYTIDACFISRQWHVRTIGQYAGTVISLFFIMIILEYFRRAAREYDRRLIAKYKKAGIRDSQDDIAKLPTGATVLKPIKPTFLEQFIRSFFYFVQFGAGYILMLTAMYYNGGLILAIFFGAWVGYFLAGSDTLGHVETRDACC